jgi:hypothetical protein
VRVVVTVIVLVLVSFCGPEATITATTMPNPSASPDEDDQGDPRANAALRHRLLSQSGGLKSFALVAIGLHAGDLAGAHRQEPGANIEPHDFDGFLTGASHAPKNGPPSPATTGAGANPCWRPSSRLMIWRSRSGAALQLRPSMRSGHREHRYR